MFACLTPPFPFSNAMFEIQKARPKNAEQCTSYPPTYLKTANKQAFEVWQQRSAAKAEKA
jgi:hypothetical protein